MRDPENHKSRQIRAPESSFVTSSLADGLDQIAAALGVDRHAPRPMYETSEARPITHIVRMAGLRARRITLPDNWHRLDCGPLLIGKNDGVEALVWDGRGYRTTAGQLSASDAQTYPSVAYSISAPLPDGAQDIWRLARHVLAGSGRDIVMAILSASGIAILGATVPIAIGWVLAGIVPNGLSGLLISVGIALAFAAVFAAIFSAARGLALARIDGRGAMNLGTGLADRILSLPVRTISSYSPGDLSQRLRHLDAVRSVITSLAMNVALTLILSSVYLAVLFRYHPQLAASALGLMLVHVAAVTYAHWRQRDPIRAAAQLEGKAATRLYETLQGIGKLRVAAAEERAFARWDKHYTRLHHEKSRSGQVSVAFLAFTEAYQIITLLILFAVAAALGSAQISAASLIGFLAAFAVFQGAITGLVHAALQVWSTLPFFDLARPVLAAAREDARGHVDPGILSGHIELRGLVFSYMPELTPVIDGVDLTIAPGEHIAIVGPSGSGKSTLLRLLLGFETPQSGSVLYDGQDLADLDRPQLRAQIGAVLQSSRLFSGSIQANIRGASEATLEQCLAAADRVGLSRDLDSFPMGIHTLVTEGGGTLSGGQRQRILVARALCGDRQMLFFDEATSALDNETQSVVTGTLDALKISRITIAHRLSTVRNADRICVLHKGRIVETGSFEALMAKGGFFAQLARRQLLEEH